MMQESRTAVLDRGQVAFLDRPVARVLAMGVLILVVCALTWIHRDDLWPAESGDVATEDDPVAQCLAARASDIDGMVADRTISADQATLFKSRAEALCQAQAGQAGAPPPE